MGFEDPSAAVVQLSYDNWAYQPSLFSNELTVHRSTIGVAEVMHKPLCGVDDESVCGSPSVQQETGAIEQRRSRVFVCGPSSW